MVRWMDALGRGVEEMRKANVDVCVLSKDARCWIGVESNFLDL